MKNKTKSREMSTKMLTVDIIQKEKEIMKIWKDYFKKPLEGKDIDKERDVQMIEETEDDDFNMLALELAIGKLHNGKSPGVDEATVEMIKAAGATGIQWLQSNEGEKRKYLMRGKKGIIVPIYKWE